MISLSVENMKISYHVVLSLVWPLTDGEIKIKRSNAVKSAMHFVFVCMQYRKKKKSNKTPKNKTNKKKSQNTTYVVSYYILFI